MTDTDTVSVTDQADHTETFNRSSLDGGLEGRKDYTLLRGYWKEGKITSSYFRYVDCQPCNNVFNNND